MLCNDVLYAAQQCFLLFCFDIDFPFLRILNFLSFSRSFQAQFVLCIFHTIRAMFASDCEFPKFISALLLLNASIFFVLFMNFYVQNYKKRRDQEQSCLAAAAKANGAAASPIEAKKVN